MCDPATPGRSGRHVTVSQWSGWQNRRDGLEDHFARPNPRLNILRKGKQTSDEGGGGGGGEHMSRHTQKPKTQKITSVPSDLPFWLSHSSPLQRPRGPADTRVLSIEDKDQFREIQQEKLTKTSHDRSTTNHVPLLPGLKSGH